MCALSAPKVQFQNKWLSRKRERERERERKKSVTEENTCCVIFAFQANKTKKVTQE